MADFIHIADARDARRIARNGLTPSRKIRVATRQREMRLDIIGQAPVWQPFDKAVLDLNNRFGRAVQYRNVEVEVRILYLMPLVPNSQVAFGWTREIGQKSNAVVAVQVRIPDDEIVYCGFYNGVKHEMTAAAAYALVRAAKVTDAQHYEVALARRVEPSEIRRTFPMRKLTGWRYYPNSHGDRPDKYGFAW